MSSTAAHSAMAAEAIAVQRLWYTKIPNTAVCMFLIFSSKVLGYGIASLMRKIIVYPTKFFYIANLPIMSLLETLHRKKQAETKPQLKAFYWAFALIFVWEGVPEYMMPILTGVSIFCLAMRNSTVFTNKFGGANGNEGLGFLSLCFDFQYNGSSLSFFLVAFWSQHYLRRYKPEFLLRFNYVLCAGLDGGTKVIVFIMTLVFFGACGKPIAFPE